MEDMEELRRSLVFALGYDWQPCRLSFPLRNAQEDVGGMLAVCAGILQLTIKCILEAKHYVLHVVEGRGGGGGGVPDIDY